MSRTSSVDEEAAQDEKRARDTPPCSKGRKTQKQDPDRAVGGTGGQSGKYGPGGK